MSASPNYYELLQVSPSAEQEVIQAAYKRLVDKWHTGRQPGDRSAFERLSRLDEAFTVLSDPSSRKEYDSARQAISLIGTRSEIASTPRIDERRSGTETEQDCVIADAPVALEVAAPVKPDPQVNDAARNGQISIAAWLLFIIGAILFGMGRGRDLFVYPVVFLTTCMVWGLFFGLPAYFCFRSERRGGMTSTAFLFCAAASLDVAALFYLRSPPPAQAALPNDVPSDEAFANEPLNRVAAVGQPSLVLRGMAADENGVDYDSAIRDYNDAIRLHPDSAINYLERGRV